MEKGTQSWEEVYYEVAHGDVERSYVESDNSRRIVDFMRSNLRAGEKVLELR